jgi:FKBP-type peptidyl-prolyl cis-trans isomerases 1
MRHLSILTVLFVLFVFSFSSCKDDEDNTYTEWKIMNQSWLHDHKNDSAFYQTPSGLCYQVIHQGYMTRPSLSSVVTVKYTGNLIDGTVFDSDSTMFQLGGTIVGWQEGLSRMNAGGHYIFYIPYALAYGSSGSYGTGIRIPPYSTLIFDVELTNVDNLQ